MAVLRFLGRLFTLLALFLLGLGIYIWLDGRATDKAGQVWFETSQFTLNYAQVIIQRHLGLDRFWFDSVLPYLQRPAWEAILWAVIALLIAGGVLIFLGRSRRRRTGGFN